MVPENPMEKMDQAETSSMHPLSKPLSSADYLTPVHVSSAEKLLDVTTLIDVSEKLFEEDLSDASSIEDVECGNETKPIVNNGQIKHKYMHQFLKAEWEEEKLKFFNLKSIGSERKWLQDVLLSDSDSGDDDVDEEQLQQMLKLHVLKKNSAKSFNSNVELYQDEYSYYSSSLILDHDKYHDRQKKQRKNHVIIPKTSKQIAVKNNKKKLKKKNANKQKILEAKKQRLQQQHEKDILYKRRKVWHFISKKDIPKVCRSKTNARGTSLATLKKVAQACQREKRKEAARSQKISKEAFPRARRMAREMLLYWKKFDKVEKEHRKKAEKEALEQRKQDEEMREMKRQQRKLNFLITQTELYAHFMGKKMKGNQDAQTAQNDILKKLDDSANSIQRSVHGGILVNNDTDDYDPEAMKTKALITAQNAVLNQEKKINGFDKNGIEKPASQRSFDSTFSLANPTLNKEKELPQPKIFDGKLKTYQLKGMNWLISLYEQGINGILADEMGLGKTVQSISFLSYLAEAHDIWGPFLVVAPASTLHNWQQEFARFLPQFKVLPYWGDPNDRKSLRNFWNQTSSYLTDKDEAPFHVLITSYQLIVQDVKYFQRIRWQYLILDEAHAIKSSSSLRWKILLGYNCRNRLLLTGTPIQNTMAELWALLHFIMPTLFDSHDEFNEWFSKDIENHASERKPSLDQNQLSRLHMILKPFMLRRIKKDVENELSEKIEIKVICEMSSRQKLFYQAVKNKIMFEDLLQSTSSNSEKSTSLLMNLVMQFRKVCNHPELFERKEPSTGFYFKLPQLKISKQLYWNGLLNELPDKQTSIFEKLLMIWTPLHIHKSLQEDGSCFGFSRFIDLSPEECFLLFRSLLTRLIHCLLTIKLVQNNKYKQSFDNPHTQHNQENRQSNKIKTRRKYLTRKDLMICTPSMKIPNQVDSLTDILFVRHTSQCAGITSCKITELDSNEDRIQKEPVIRNCVAVDYPKFLTSYSPKVYSPPVEVYCSDRSAAYQYKRRVFGTDELLKLYRSGLHSLSSEDQNRLLFPAPKQGLDTVRPLNGWSRVRVPDRSTMLSDSGKLMVLDQLLTQMKKEGHRVLIYSQMTKMIDILEEFMNFRQHSYIRLDGSSKIGDRRDMVNDFQSRDIFAFLLSTRAGGLGINLTAADTVIFYDSDWNPTVDQQAMDRAHRLGQKRQVTVYRLVTKGTVEEKILNRAREKSEIQNIVISGGQFNKDVLRPKEVVSLLLDDVELEAKLKQRQAEKKLAELSGKRPGRKRKNPVDVTNADASKMTKAEESNDLTNGNCLQRMDSIDSLDENSMSSVDFAGMNSSELSNDNSSRPSSVLASSPSQSPTTMNGKKRGRGRGRGGKNKSGSLARAAASVAAAAGALAGRDAAYAQYGYSFHKTSK